MQITSPQFLQALRGPHQVVVRVDAVLDGLTVASDLELSSGQVAVDATSRTRSQFTGVFSDKSLASTFSKAGVELVVKAGLRFFGTQELLPQGVFPVGSWQLQYGPDAGIQVSCPDRWTVVQRSRFLLPKQWDPTWTSVSAAVGGLMLGPWVDRQAPVVPSFSSSVTPLGAAQPATVWTRDRDKAITDMVTSLSGEAFFDENGNAILRPRPTLSTVALWDADAGDSGVLMAASRSRSWEQVYNAVAVTGVDPADSQTVTARGTATVNDATAPLWINGPFGTAPLFYSSPLIKTDAQAVTAAATLLDTAASYNASLAATCVPNAALQAGDTIQVTLPGGVQELHVLQGFTLPLTVDGSSNYSMPLTLRSSKSDLPSETL